MDEKIEQYKIIIDIYYKEVSLFYIKSTTLTTVQIAILGGGIAGIEKLLESPHLLRLGVIFLMIFSAIQICVAFRGYCVNQALIATISDFEKDNNLALLKTFNKKISGLRFGIKLMNSPSLAVVIINVLFFISWLFIFINTTNME